MPDSLPILLLTRPEDASRRVVQQLQERGCTFRPVISPLIGIDVTGPLPDMADAKGLIFTSANGVEAYCAFGGPLDLPAYTVGRVTAEAAARAGLLAQSADGNAEALIAWLGRLRPDAPLFHLHGTHTRGDVAGRLSAAGVPTREMVIYDQPALPLNEAAQRVLDGTTPVVVPLYSPRSAKLLRETRIKAPLLVAALSEAVAKAASPLHISEMRIAPRPDSGDLLPLVADLLKRARNEGVRSRMNDPDQLKG